ncbi:hypothetical protein ABH940_005566 [Streptacidiphilus sp. BW17]|uniref:hypothetical protein n=1 Tax=Streptacidiphilus sp. BW17 TaxID=3156274 RepID=UPI0035136FBF
MITDSTWFPDDIPRIQILPEDLERMSAVANALQEIRTSIRRSAKRPPKLAAVLLAGHIEQLSAFIAAMAIQWESLTTTDRLHAASTGEMWTQQFASSIASEALSSLVGVMEHAHQAANRARPPALRRVDLFHSGSAAHLSRRLYETEAQMGARITILRQSRASLVDSLRRRPATSRTAPGPAVTAKDPGAAARLDAAATASVPRGRR